MCFAPIERDWIISKGEEVRKHAVIETSRRGRE
jgi:hypothetical protein